MKITFDDSGLKELEKKLDKLTQQTEIPYDDLFFPSFMQSCSNFSSFEELLDSSPFSVNSKEDFEAIPDADFDVYISKVTSYDTWEEMLNAAGAEYVKKELGL